MSKSNLNKVFETTKEANAILSKAGGVMFKSSVNTAKLIANLYKDAGLKAFGLSREVVKKTVELAIKNQKELLKTSGAAFKEVTQTILEKEEVQSNTTPNGGAKKTSKQARQPKTKKDVTIDDLL